MDLGLDCPKLLARCRPTSGTLGDFAVNLKAFLSELMMIHPAFASLRVDEKSNKQGVPLRADLSNLDDFLLERSWDRKAPRAWYDPIGIDGKPNWLSQSTLGFNAHLDNAQSWDGKVSVVVRSGGLTANICNIVLPRKDHPEFRQQAIASQLMNLVVKHWPVHHASFATGGWHDAVNWTGDDEGRGNMEIGWLTYVDDPSIAQHLPPELTCCNSGSGVIFQLGQRFSSYLDPEDLALGLRVKQALAAAGRLRVRPVAVSAQAARVST